jgi:hypothetical protein
MGKAGAFERLQTVLLDELAHSVGVPGYPAGKLAAPRLGIDQSGDIQLAALEPARS